jgi:replicative DNA helicase
LSRFDKEIRTILNAIDVYWRSTEGNEWNQELFESKFFLNSELTQDERRVYAKIFKVMQEEPDKSTAKEIVRELRLLKFSKEVEDVQTSYALGEEIDLYEAIRDVLQEFEHDVRRTSDAGYCTATVEEVLQDGLSGNSLEWGLECLNRSMPDLRTGFQVIVAARPGVGKTSFVVDQCVHFVRGEYIQASRRPVVWFNNEGKGIRIRGGFLRAALNRNFEQIAEMGLGNAERLLTERTGDPSLFQVYDIHGKDYKYLERVFEKVQPCVVVWDMLDNVKGAPGHKSGDRTDQRLEGLYQWARESAAIYDFLSIPTSQVSVEGAGMQWIPENALKDSKTGKQGACDAIITIGTNDKPGFERSRFIYLPKTKSEALPGAFADCRTEVVFNKGTGNYLNPKLPQGEAK